SPSLLFLGRRVSAAGAALSWQAVTVGSTTWRRQRPVWMTRGMLLPTGTFWSWSVPFGAYTMPLTVVVMPAGVQLCCWRQRPVHVGGTPHWPGIRPPHVVGSEQPPHWTSPPQPSAFAPQSMAPQVAGVHVWTHVLGVPWQAWFVPQVPQSSIPLQPSPCMPQLDPSEAQVVGVHAVPHMLATPPPPQVCPVGQPPQ